MISWPLRTLRHLHCLLLLLALSAPAWAYKAYLWRVDSPSTTLWLYGTVHLGKADMFPLPPSVMRAFHQSPVAVFELDMDRVPHEITALYGLTLYPKGDSLSAHMGPQRWQQLKQALPSLYGMSADAFQKSRPWFLAMTLSMQSLLKDGWSEQYSVDAWLDREARQQGKTIIGLETTRQQLEAMGQLREDTQISWLFSQLDPKLIAKQRELMQLAVRSWRQGEPEQMNDMLLQDSPGMTPQQTKEFAAIMLSGRNRKMADKLVQMLKGKQTAFVAVGALHYAGPDNLLALLRQRGFKPIQQDNQ
ncbi:TraB/GumN family protein [Leeia sp.]|uniref:TraB/GumN family protein n=1 Tax=Leeia sp. TaxID=2884678 RepID=UPI0035AE0A91